MTAAGPLFVRPSCSRRPAPGPTTLAHDADPPAGAVSGRGTGTARSARSGHLTPDLLCSSQTSRARVAAAYGPAVLPDLWTTSDLPVLTELVRLLEVEGRNQVELPLAVGALTEQQLEAALRRLYGAGYIDGVTIDQAAHPIVVTSVGQKALQAHAA